MPAVYLLQAFFYKPHPFLRLYISTKTNHFALSLKGHLTDNQASVVFGLIFVTWYA